MDTSLTDPQGPPDSRCGFSGGGTPPPPDWSAAALPSPGVGRPQPPASLSLQASPASWAPHLPTPPSVARCKSSQPARSGSARCGFRVSRHLLSTPDSTRLGGCLPLATGDKLGLLRALRWSAFLALAERPAWPHAPLQLRLHSGTISLWLLFRSWELTCSLPPGRAPGRHLTRMLPSVHPLAAGQHRTQSNSMGPQRKPCPGLSDLHQAQQKAKHSGSHASPVRAKVRTSHPGLWSWASPGPRPKVHRRGLCHLGPGKTEHSHPGETGWGTTGDIESD